MSAELASAIASAGTPGSAAVVSAAFAAVADVAAAVSSGCDLVALEAVVGLESSSSLEEVESPLRDVPIAVPVK